jgi:hypothetical protein
MLVGSITCFWVGYVPHFGLRGNCPIEAEPFVFQDYSEGSLKIRIYVVAVFVHAHVETNYGRIFPNLLNTAFETETAEAVDQKSQRK